MTAREALAGTTVVEWGCGRPSAYAGKLLRDFGAEVILVEDGPDARERALPVAATATRQAQRDALVRFMHGGKRSVLLDHRDAGQRERLLALLARADAVIIHHPIDELDALGLSPEAIAEAHPGLVVVPITLAGLGPSARHLRHSDVAAHAMGGIAFSTPNLVEHPSEAPPLKLGGHQADYTAGLTAAVATLLGLQLRRRTGTGTLMDVSAQATIASYVRMNIAYWTYDAPDPMKLNAHGAHREGKPLSVWGLVPCKDGYFAFQASEQYQWDGLMRTMGDPEWSRDPRFQDPYDRLQHWEEIERHFLAWTMEHTKDEIFHAAQANHVPVFPCYTVEELLDDQQSRARAFFVDVPAGTNLVRVPGALIHLEKSPWRHEMEAPAVGQDTDAIAAMEVAHDTPA